MLFDPFFRNHSPAPDGQIDYIAYGMVYGSQSLSGIIEVLILTVIVGGALYILRHDQRDIPEQNWIISHLTLLGPALILY